MIKPVKISLILILFISGFTFGGTVKNYSADLVEINSNRIIGKIYAAEQKLRLEIYDEKGVLTNISIIRMDRKKIYSMNAESGTYVEFPIMGAKQSLYDNFLMIGQSFGVTPNIKRERLGTDTVSGYSASKFRNTTSIEIFNDKMVTVSYEWIAPEFDWPLRTQDDEGIVEMRNIKTKTPGDSLFEIPLNYKRDLDMEELFGEMGAWGGD